MSMKRERLQPKDVPDYRPDFVNFQNRMKPHWVRRMACSISPCHLPCE